MELELRIERLGAQGDGVARGPDGPLFVPLNLPGELVRISAPPGGELLAILEQSPQRVARRRAEAGANASARPVSRAAVVARALTLRRGGARSAAGWSQGAGRALGGSKVPRIVMVSCNPATCARAARSLIDGGYRVTRVVPVDQFLFSPHIELVALLER